MARLREHPQPEKPGMRAREGKESLRQDAPGATVDTPRRLRTTTIVLTALAVAVLAVVIGLIVA